MPEKEQTEQWHCWKTEKESDKSENDKYEQSPSWKGIGKHIWEGTVLKRENSTRTVLERNKLNKVKSEMETTEKGQTP